MARSTTRNHGDTHVAGLASSPSAALLLLGVGLLAGCGLMALIGPFGASDNDQAATSGAALTKAVERLTDRFDGVVTQQGEIARRMTDLELAMLGAPSTREVMPITSDGTPVELSEIRESMAQVASALESGDTLAKGPIVNQVIEAMTLIEERDEAERAAERAERRQERLEQQLEDLTEMLGLDGNQQLSMQELLTDAAAKREAIDDEASSRNERRDARDALIEETRDMAAGFLSPAQIQLLQDNGGLDLRGGGGGGGRGGRGGR
jgi:hypothetical protein